MIGEGNSTTGSTYSHSVSSDEPARQGEVSREMMELSTTVDRLESDLATLLEKVKPVMGRIEERPKSESKPSEPDTSTPHGQELKKIRHRLSDLVEAIRYMAAKIEL